MFIWLCITIYLTQMTFLCTIYEHMRLVVCELFLFSRILLITLNDQLYRVRSIAAALDVLIL